MGLVVGAGRTCDVGAGNLSAPVSLLPEDRLWAATQYDHYDNW